MTTIAMGDLATVVEPGRFARSFNCWLEQHKGCWFPQYSCQCHCHPESV